MKQYHLFEIWFDTYGIFFRTTDDATKAWVFKAIKGVSPSAEINELPNVAMVGIKKLNGKDIELGWQLLTQLCAKGWEPFGITAATSSNLPHLRTYFLRLEVGSN